MQLSAVRTLTVRGQSQGLDKVKSDLDQVSASQQGVAQSATVMASATETSARRQLSAANAFERLMERNDRMIYLQRQLEREMNVVNRAHEQGAIDASRHSQAVDLLQAKYQRLAAAEAAARAQITGTTQAMDAQAAAAHRLGAANDNARAGQFNAANVAAQLQDIGVTAAMGQSPLTIALQQGTQLSAVLGQQGLTGVVKTLGAAFFSIINPVSLITIGVVGLAAAGIQAFMNTQRSVEDSTDALEEHKEWLDKILAGYDAAADAADTAREAALKLPQGAVASNLQADLRQQEEERRALQERIETTRANLVDIAEIYASFGRRGGEGNIMGDIAAQIDAILELGISTASTREELDAATTAATELMNATDDETVRDLASQMISLAGVLRTTASEMDATAAAARELDAALQFQVSIRGLGVGDALADIKALTPDLRSAREQVAELFALNAPQARTTSELQALADAAEAAYAALDKQDAQREAEKAATASTNALKQQQEAYDNLVKSIEDRVAQAEFEATLIGKSADEQARLRIEFELTKQAAEQAIPADKLQQWIDREVKAEKAARDTNKALEDRKKLMDQLAGSAQTIAGSLMGATGLGNTPFGSAINGGLGSLLKGDFIGAAIGGITGLITGFIEQEQRRQQAITAANDNKPSINAFINQGLGKEVDEMSIAVQRFKQQAAEYIKLAEAAGDRALVRRLQEAAAAYRDTLRTQQRMERLEDRVETSRDRLREAYERESSALRDVIQQQTAYVDSLKSFKQSLLLDSNLSPLSPQDRLVQAQMDFQRTSSAALGGDVGAQARLQDAATSYLEQARNFYASSGAYASIFDQVQSVLDRAIATGTAQISDSERQLQAMTDQVAQLGVINNSVISVTEAVNQLRADMARLLAAQIAAAEDAARELRRQNRENSQNSGRRAANG